MGCFLIFLLNSFTTGLKRRTIETKRMTLMPRVQPITGRFKEVAGVWEGRGGGRKKRHALAVSDTRRRAAAKEKGEGSGEQ